MLKFTSLRAFFKKKSPGGTDRQYVKFSTGANASEERVRSSRVSGVSKATSTTDICSSSWPVFFILANSRKTVEQKHIFMLDLMHAKEKTLSTTF